MEPTRKRSLFGLFSGMEDVFRDLLYDKPRVWLIESREKVRDLPKTNFDLGVLFAEEKKWFDALFRFRIVLFLQPNYPQAKYNLGCCYYNLNKRAKARATLQEVIRETPTHQDAIFMLAAIDPNAVPAAQRPQSMPRDMVTNFFTSIATDYNAIEAQNQYRGGVAVAEVVKPLLKTPAANVVDLGCGSGIAAIPFRAEATQLIGVDITPAMVNASLIAGQADKKLYDRVIEADLNTLGDVLPAESADLVLLVNVVQFVGALTNVIPNAARLLKPGALLAMTTEPFTGTEGFGIVADTGRFGHNASYVKRIAATAGLTLVNDSRVALYATMGAELFVFSKGTH